MEVRLSPAFHHAIHRVPDFTPLEMEGQFPLNHIFRNLSPLRVEKC